MGTSELDRRVLALVAAGDTTRALNEILSAMAPEVFGFLVGALRNELDAEEVFAAWSVCLWQSLASFEGRCSLRTWTYVLARHEIGRFRRGAKRHGVGRVPISELESVLAAARTETRSALGTDKRKKLAKLRDALSLEDRTLLILRVDRNLAWDEIALAFVDQPEKVSEADRKREAARLRKRFQLVKQRLAARARGDDPKV